MFRETLNETRDADRGDDDRYSARFYLKHSFLEQAFDMLIDAGFELKAACGESWAILWYKEKMGARVLPGKP